jgi:hypothetical protein
VTAHPVKDGLDGWCLSTSQTVVDVGVPDAVHELLSCWIRGDVIKWNLLAGGRTLQRRQGMLPLPGQFERAEARA